MRNLREIALLDAPDLLLQESISADTQKDRMIIMAKRLVAGLLLSMQQKANFKDRVVPYRTGRPGRHEEEPSHRIVMVGRPLKIDCRESVKKFIDGTSAKKHGKYTAPSVQFLVRGHFRRQVCGVGRRDRKTIWIEPHWKGDSEAVILTRGKKLIS